MPSRAALLALAAAVVLAGCSGPSDPGTTPAPETTSPAPTITPPDSTGTTIPPDEVVDYRDLPDGTQRLVRIAVENGSVRRDYDEFEGLSQAEGEAHEFLRYDGTTYAIEWRSHMRAEYHLTAVEPTNDTEAITNSTVVAYENLSASGQRMFDQVGGGRNHSEGYEFGAFPEALQRHKYVRHEGQFYRTVVIHGDIPVWELRLQPVDGERNEG